MDSLYDTYFYYGREAMNFDPEELKYLKHVLECTGNYAIARGEQILYPSVSHKKIKEKIDVIINRMYS